MNPSWPEVPLGNVLKRVARFEERDDLTEYQFAGTYSFARGIFVGERKLGSTFKLSKVQRIHEGDFVYCKIMAWEGAFGIVPEEAHNCVMSGAFVAYEVDQNQINPHYLDYYFKIERVWQSIGRQSTGTNVRRRSLHHNQFEAATIPLPPLDEQRRIVACIEELAALIEEAQGLRAKAREEAEALLKVASADAFGQLGLSDDQWVGLDSVTERITKGESPGWQGFSYVDDGPLFIRSENVLWGQLDLSSEARIQLAFHKKLSRSQLRSGDVLINLVGASIGRAAVVPDNLGEANVNQAVAVITPKQKLDSRFLVLFLISPLAQRILHGGKVETARPNISLTDLRNLRVPVLSLDQQHSIVTHLDAMQAHVDELTALQDATQAELDTLLPSVLDQAFRGEL
jgi:type I restriction enzyme S subunit